MEKCFSIAIKKLPCAFRVVNTFPVFSVYLKREKSIFSRFLVIGLYFQLETHLKDLNFKHEKRKFFRKANTWHLLKRIKFWDFDFDFATVSETIPE